ncbi:MAG: PAS domain-containing protein [Candidatus Tectomicrobia bacterium]|uniref:protein-glutamate O-methyltransferase n=1 Tax=Tectimicrobiota bacterium TaxID=2528274 RepID=A0A932HZF2_UNCTE|nr:PAS domain-containing protein [Candidatus Tectomicrobia bacterium]
MSETAGGPSLVVGIGASAGGLEAVEEFLRATPADTGMCFIVVMHHHPGHVSLLPDILSKRTRMRVAEARDGARLEWDTVFVGLPGMYLSLGKGVLRAKKRETEEYPRLPIDRFFRSLAETQKNRAVGVILSGTGTDGTLGIRAIKAESGMVMAQKPDTAKYAGMPKSAIGTGLADFVLPPEEMPRRLVLYAETFMRRPSGPGKGKKGPEEPRKLPSDMRRIFTLLRNRTGHDFSCYKASTLHRRIDRRMAVHQLEEMDYYIRFMQENPHEIDLLFKEMLINVTNFFRDPPAFESLYRNGLPRLFDGKPEGMDVRVWVPGCATGEEAYSLAMLLREYLEESKRRHNVQIFATDLDGDAVNAGRAGVYPEGIAADVGEERIKRFFAKQDSHYRISKEIRDMVIFADQNITRDPPFTRLDILSCRNVLIYLDADLQKRLLPLFHYALNPGGILFIGPAETVGEMEDSFEAADSRWKIFRRKPGSASARHQIDFPISLSRKKPREDGTEERPKAGNIAAAVEALLLDRYAPPCAIVSEDGKIEFIHGRTGEFLEPASGAPNFNAIEMAREGLRRDLSAALRRAAAMKKDVLRRGIGVKANGGELHLDLSVKPLDEPEAVRGLFMVSFLKAPPAPPPGGPEGKGGKARRAAEMELEEELRRTQETLKTTIEELETSNEELKSTNEELHSTNEELQSTNEELETSREELQSLNEELQTVNSELEVKVHELTQSHADMQNLLDSTGIAAVFLDEGLRIQRYTREVDKFVRLIPSDAGRPIRDLTVNLRDADLVAESAEVLRTLAMKEMEVRTHAGDRCRVRILPYRTVENVIAGVVLTFMNVEEIRETQDALAFARSIVDTVREPMLVLDGDLRVVSANQSFFRVFRGGPERAGGKLVYELAGGEWDIPDLRRLLNEILTNSAAFNDFEVEHEFPEIGRRRFLLNARRMSGGGKPLILLAFEDATGGE